MVNKKETQGVKIKLLLSNMRLATKTSIAVVVTLAIILTVLIGISLINVDDAIKESVQGEFSAIAAQNGTYVKGIINDTDDIAGMFQDYLTNRHKEFNDHSKTVSTKDLPKQKSALYDTLIFENNIEIESYILNMSWSLVNNNENICGVGVLYEPYAFDENIKDYSVIIREEEAKNKTAVTYGDYSNYSSKEYYKKAIETKKPYFTDPYVNQGTTVVTAAFPISNNGKIDCVVIINIDVSNFANMKTTDGVYKTMNSNVITNNGIYIYDTDTQYSGKSMEDYFAKPQEYTKMMEKLQTNTHFEIITTREDGRKIARYCVPVDLLGQTWFAQTYLDVSDLNEDVTRIVIIMISISLVALLAIAIVTTAIIKKMINPIQNVLDAANSIAAGNLNVELSAKSGDEIGQLSVTFNKMADNLKEIVLDIDQLLGAMADGDFTHSTQIEGQYVGAYKNVLLAVKNIKSNLSDTLNKISEASNEVNAGSDQVSIGAQALSQGATEQASSIEELSATINQISDQININAENATTASRVSEQASIGLMKSNKKMEQMISAMDIISTKSDQIKNIIKTIDGIAFQTNILALNAAVEAARAGAAGKGFAVVADEVRNLAGKSAEAAKNTAELIEETINAVSSGTKIVDEAAKALNVVLEGGQQSVDLINKIATASNEQADAIEQINLGVEQISTVVQTNSATAQQSAAASEELSGQAQMLRDTVSRFKLPSEVDNLA